VKRAREGRGAGAEALELWAGDTAREARIAGQPLDGWIEKADDAAYEASS